MKVYLALTLCTFIKIRGTERHIIKHAFLPVSIGRAGLVVVPPIMQYPPHGEEQLGHSRSRLGLPAQRNLQAVGLTIAFAAQTIELGRFVCSLFGIPGLVPTRGYGHSLADDSWQLGFVKTSPLNSIVYFQYGGLSGSNTDDVFQLDLHISLTEFIRSDHMLCQWSW
jgi:hypothetical protein